MSFKHEKVHEGQKADLGVVVAVANRVILCALLLSFWSSLTQAVVLPEDTVDMLYHRYEGGGIKVDGPSILVRKSAGSHVSMSANYYVDMVSSASVDVIASASPYTEERTEYGASIDILNDKSIISTSYTRSTENDYEASTVHFGINQSFFGDLSTLSMGYTNGANIVKKTGDKNFSEPANSNGFQLGLSQVITKNTLLSLNYEGISDDGYLHNPYRQVRFVASGSKGFDFQDEVYPKTRTSNAMSISALYYLPYRAAIKSEYRYFSDTWGIQAQNIELAYTHPFQAGWILDIKYRYYAQTQADFYSDLFPFRDAQNFLARDKEMSTYSTNTIGLGLSYTFSNQHIPFIDRGSINLFFDHIMFKYDNFRDITQSGNSAGTEPLYAFSADVTRFFMTIWY